VEVISVWTFQTEGFSILEGPVKPELSKYAKKYPTAYQRLWKILGTKQFIWCMTDRRDWGNKKGFCEWALSVPRRNVLRVIDSMVWNGIIGEKGSPPAKMFDELERYATLNDIPDVQSYIEQHAERLRNPPGDPWDCLFLDDLDDPRAEILLRCPIQGSWHIKSVL
jgi:hypothetical protein